MRGCNMLLKFRKKSVIFSLDVLLAFISTITLVVGSFFYISQVQGLQWGQPGIYIVTLDSLNTLKIDDTFRDAVDMNNSENLTIFLNNMLETQMCSELEFYNRSGTLKLSINKSSCGNASTVYVARRTFIINNTVYYATMRSWYKNATTS